MSRKSKIEPVREYLEELINDITRLQEVSAKMENYKNAEVYKSIKESLEKALKLCGEEKPKEDKKENG